MTWLDGQIDLIVANQTPGLITVWNRNPNTFALEGYGVTYDAMAPAQKAAVEDWLGPAPAKPPEAFGDINTFYDIRMNCTDSAESQYFGVGYSGKLRVEAAVGTIVNNGLGKRWVVTIRGGIDNPSGTGTADLVIFCGPNSLPPLVTFLARPSGEPAPATSGGYPPLTAAELAVVTGFYAAVRSVAASGTGIRPEVIAQLTAQVEEVAQVVTPLRPAIDAIPPLLAPIGTNLTAVQSEIATIKTKVQDILDCTCLLTVDDCQGIELTGLQIALQLIILTVCDIQTKIGYSPGKITVPGTPPRDLLTVRESLADINRRLGFDNTLTVDRCDSTADVENVEQYIALVDGNIGLDIGITTGRIGTDGQPITVCTLREGLNEVISNPGELSVYRGVEVDSLPVRILKIYYNEGQKYRKQAGMQIPNPDIGVTRDEILAALGPKVSGDWLCQLTFTSGRKLLGWFDSEESGLDYLARASALSGDVVVVGSDAATHNPADSPTRYSGVTLSPTVAFVVPTTAEGTLPRRIPLI